MLILAFVYNGVTAGHSLALLIVFFFISAVSTTTNVVYLPHLASMRPELLTTFFSGLGLGSLVASVASLVQGKHDLYLTLLHSHLQASEAWSVWWKRATARRRLSRTTYRHSSPCKSTTASRGRDSHSFEYFRRYVFWTKKYSSEQEPCMEEGHEKHDDCSGNVRMARAGICRVLIASSLRHTRPFARHERVD